MNNNKFIQSNSKLPDNLKTYNAVRGYIIAAQKQVYSTINSSKVIAYLNIGKQIYEASGKNDRASNGKQLLQFFLKS